MAIDGFVASYRAGAHKPDIAPFDLAEPRLEVDEFVMNGDDDANIEGAEAAGWRATRYAGDGFEDYDPRALLER